MIKKIYISKISIIIALKIFIFLMFFLAFLTIAYKNYPFTKFFSINLGTSSSTYGSLFLILNYIYGGFKLGENKISDSVYSQNLSGILALIFTYFQLCILFNNWLNIIPIIVIMVANLGISVASSIVFSYFYNKFYPPKNTIIIHNNKEVNINSLINKIKSRPDKYILKDIISTNQDLDSIFECIKSAKIVFLCKIDLEYRKIIIDYCYKHNISVYFIPLISDILINKASFFQISDTPTLACNYKELSVEQQIIKRIFDLILSSILLIITLPIIIITAIFIKLYDFGPIFFIQNRVTIHNKVFKLYKFRSMIVDAEKDGIARLASKNDSRITPIGKIIRMLRIDELPQLINILKGDMSIVGPRPERPEIIAKNVAEIPAFEYRTKVKAGITGFAQIKGKYNTPPIDKLIMDLMYIESYSILQDLKLVFLTIKVIFIPESSEGI